MTDYLKQANEQSHQVILPFQGFYESIHDDAFDRVIEMREEDGAEIDFSYTNEIMLAYCQHFGRELAGKLESIIGSNIDIQVVRVTSPREYNFETDKIHAIMNRGDIIKLYDYVMENHEEAFRSMVESELTERSGFIPRFSNNLDDWGHCVDWKPIQFQLLIDCLMIEEEGQDWEEDIQEILVYNGYVDTLIP